MEFRFAWGMIAALAITSAVPAQAQQAAVEWPAEMPAECTMVDSKEIISVVVCSAALTDEEFASAGRAVCGDKLPCGAWFWPSAEVAPAAAPENHDGLTQAEVTSAYGVWVAEANSFIRIDKVD